MSTEVIPGANDILIGHTTICEASRIFSNSTPDITVGTVHASYAPPPFIMRFLEWCVLVEAVVLHDTLFTLPAELPSDVKQLELRKQLLTAGIVREYTSPALQQEIIPSLQEWIVNNAKKYQKGPGPYGIFRPGGDSLVRMTLGKMVDRAQKRDAHTFYSADKQSGVNDIDVNELDDVARFIKQLKNTDTLAALSKMSGNIGLNISYYGSGAYEASLPTLRSLMYWQVSEASKLAWSPDVLRVPILIALNQGLRASVGAQVYAIVAQAFDAAREELLDADVSYEIFIPPLAAILLSRTSESTQLTRELFALRDEFASFRTKFRQMEERRRIVATVKEMKEVRSEIKALFRAVAEKHKDKDSSFVENTLGYAPDIVKPLVNPLDPSSYSGELLKKPYRWIREWWTRRPAARLFSVTRKLEQLETYGKLVPRVFGVEITKDDGSFIRKYYQTFRTLTKSFKYETT